MGPQVTLWANIAAGTVRLTPDQDAALWRLRAEGKGWNAIERTLRGMVRRLEVRARPCLECGKIYASHDRRRKFCASCGGINEK